MHNIDRGLIKWLPFDALSGYKEAISALKDRRSKNQKPILSVDQLESLNYDLSVATQLRKNITLYYYLGGKIYYFTGFVSEVDLLNKQIKLGNNWLKAQNILNIEIN